MLTQNSLEVSLIFFLPSMQGGFLHSGTFLLIDTNKNIRGIYDGTNEAEMSRLMSDIKILLKSIS